jgi:hypothetical protein
MLPIKEAVTFVSYSKDYITRLARERKILATHINRQWFVDVDSLKNYEEVSSLEQDLRKKQLSETRKHEQKVREVVASKKEVRDKKEKTFHARALVATCFVLGFGLLSGWTANFLVTNSEPSLASVSDSVSDKLASLDAMDSISTEFKIETPSTKNVRVISDGVESGVILFPHGSVTTEPAEMFSDEVQVLTAENGTQMVVRVDATGRPVGNVIPFVTVPVNHLDI